jgi:hypothetical protein
MGECRGCCGQQLHDHGDRQPVLPPGAAVRGKKNYGLRVWLYVR